MTGKDMESTSRKLDADAVYLVYQNDKDDAAGFIELVSTLWHAKRLILLIAGSFGIIATVYSFLATPVFRAEALLAPAQVNADSGLPSGVTGLAGLAGVSLGGSRDVAQSIATLRSRFFAEEFIQEKNLLPVLFSDQWDSQENRWVSDDEDEWPDVRDGVKYFTDKVRFVREESDTGLVTLAVEWKDPEVAAKWVGDLVEEVNERLRARDLKESQERLEYLRARLNSEGLLELRQGISRLIESQIEKVMLAHAPSEYAFKVIDQPRIPKEPIRPRRVLVVALAIIFGFFLGCFVALFRWAILNRQGVGEAVSDDVG